MYSEQTSIPLLAVVPGRDEGEVVLHNDVCLLTNHWKHESAKSWLKALCVLDGVAFHIRVLCFNNSPLAPWSGTDIIVEKHPDVQMIMANDDTLKKFKEILPRWKQAFANAVAISPLVLILGKGIGQMLNTSQALQNPILGLESKAGIHTCQWLQSTEDKWMASLVRTKGRGASFHIALDPHFQGSLVMMFARVQRWGHENFCDFLDEKTGKEPWRLPAATAPLTMEDVDPMSVEEIIVGNLPQSQEHDNSLLNAKEVEYHTKKLTQDDNQSWNAVPVSALSRKHRRSRSPEASDTKAKKTKVDHNLSRSEIGICSPLVWVQSTDTHASFDYFPLQSNEVDDREMITAWNDCVMLDNPRYRLPEMGKGMDNSMITTMAHSVAMDNPSMTLETFQNYNIYHYMRAHHPLSRSLPNLSLVGNVDSLREVQDHQRQASKEMKDNINVNMSLRELFEEGLEQEGHVLNALALPLSYQATVEHLNTHPICRQIYLIQRIQYPQQASGWWLPRAPSATCIVIAMVLKSTWGTGHLVSFQVQMNERPRWYCWNLDWPCNYMRPDTHHAVLTLKNSIVKGHHIYATTTLAKSVMGWIHTCMLEYRIANVLHPELHELPLRIMCHFYRVMTNDDNKGFHYLEIPEMSRNGLLNIIALGNLCIFSSALLPCIEESPEQVKIVIAMATGAYLSLIRYLKAQYRLIFLSSPENEAAAKSPCVQSMDIGDFANEVNASLNTFLHIDLMDEFLYTYKNEQKKCLHLHPVFDIRHKEDILDLGIYNKCDMFESSQASVKHMEMKDFDGKETDNEGSFDEEEQSQSGDQDEENSEDASGLEYKP
ncbi:hypothetical protein IW261DRAFT_1422904 [Armillaria novae-zelandiae]|uniref:Uncharacterized protein n=1 Tax=Armillaria novae-zelandiae TaxID=153914 RepID=A0AA39UDF3_9AGAR|nr:hypothetical protein IW261DRAFT_1422904 [Armillaria novae-zelandiae]